MRSEGMKKREFLLEARWAKRLGKEGFGFAELLNPIMPAQTSQNTRLGRLRKWGVGRGFSLLLVGWGMGGGRKMGRTSVSIGRLCLFIWRQWAGEQRPVLLLRVSIGRLLTAKGVECRCWRDARRLLASNLSFWKIGVGWGICRRSRRRFCCFGGGKRGERREAQRRQR